MKQGVARPVRHAVGIIAVTLLAACVSAPEIAPRTTALDAAALGLSGAAPAPVAARWWQAFGDPQLDALVDEALAHNPSLAEALARVDAARAQAYATGAPQRPGFTLDGEEVRQRFSEHYYIPPPFGGGTYWVGQLGVNLAWDLDFWGRQQQLIEQARGLAQAAELDRASARLALSGALAQAYVDLYRAHALGAIAARNVAQREAILRLTQDRVRAGLDTELELRNAEALLPQARAAQLQADGARELAVHRLAALSGHGAERYDSIQAPQLQLDASLPLPQALPMDLLARRPDVLAARARIDAAGAGIEAARAAFYPDINLRGFVGLQSIGLDQLTKDGSAIWGVGPALHLPLFESRRLKGAFAAASAGRDAAVASYNETVLGAVRQTADQLSLGASLAAQLAEAGQRRAAAEAAYALAQRRYQAGLSSQLVLLNAESQLIDAQREQISQQAALAISRVTLLLSLGGSFDPAANTTVAGVSP